MTRADFRLIRSFTARDIVPALFRDGFFLARQRGSHHYYRHPDGRRVTVPFTASGDTFVGGTLKSILRQARWEKEDLLRLGLLPDRRMKRAA